MNRMSKAPCVCVNVCVWCKINTDSHTLSHNVRAERVVGRGGGGGVNRGARYRGGMRKTGGGRALARYAPVVWRRYNSVAQQVRGHTRNW